MGCYEVKNSRNNLPTLTCTFESENETQKQYCLKFKDTFTHDGESLQQLEQLLHECEEREDYEQAAIIMEKINRLKGKGEQK